MKDLNEIKAQVNLIEFARRYGISCNSRNMAKCPWHTDTKPSLQIHVHEGRWTWKCFACDVGGSIVDLLMRCEKINEKAAIAKLLKEYGNKAKVRERTISEVGREHVYHDEKGTIAYKKVKYYDKKNKEWAWCFKHKDKNGNWIKGQGPHEHVPFDLHKFGKQTSCFISEGEKDAIRIQALKVEMAVTSTDGGESNWPDDITKHFKQFKRVAFCYDVGPRGDKYMHQHAAKLKEAFPEMEIKIMYIPGDHLKQYDLSDYLDEAEDEKAAFKKIREAGVKFDPAKEVKKDKPGGLIRYRLSEVEPQEISWLWYNRIPLGAYSCICGDPGSGKSIFLSHLCARITKGEPLPDRNLSNPKGTVLWFGAEEHLRATIRVRAEEAGADLSKFITIPGEKPDGSFWQFTDPDGIQMLEEEITREKDTLIVCLDTITTYASGVNENRESQVRAALSPLNILAEKHNIAIIGSAHLNKDQAKQALYRLAGSIAWLGVPRVVWMIKKEEEDPTSNKRYFAPLKANILKEPTTLIFEIFGDLGHPKVKVDLMPSDITASELLADVETQEKRSELNFAKIFLLELLEPGKPMGQVEIQALAKGDGITPITLRRAKALLPIKSEKSKERPYPWEWTLHTKK